jgi:hypothetical protein
MRLEVLAALIGCGFLSGCSSAAQATADPAAFGSGSIVTTLDAGKLDSIPTGNVFVRVIEFPQPEQYTISSKQHVPGFVYVETGLHRLTLQGQPPVDIPAGSAKFHGSIAHQHFNPGPGQSTWYFIAVWSSSLRGQAPVDRIAEFPFQSDDFTPAQLPQGVYSEVLRRVSLTSNGRSEAHRFGGLSLFFVLEGSLTIATNLGVKELKADEGAAFTPGTALQEHNAAGETCVYLEMLTTLSGQEFEIPLLKPPKG